MDKVIKHVELVPEGVLVEFKDGREALLDSETVVQCVEQTGAFDRLSTLRDELRQEAEEDAAPTS